VSDTPRPAKSGWRRFVPGWKFWVLTPLVLLGVGIVGFGIAYALTDIPDANADATGETTVVYYSDGTTELGRFAAQNRTSVAIGEMPQSLRDAAVAAEDREFYRHPGFSVTGTGRAAWNNLRGGAVQGGSTISQQLAKNLYLTQEKTVGRKVTELILAVKLEQTYSKDQILEDYLNTIYFGRGAYGVEAAAGQYFGTDVSELTLSQSAVLAALIRSPGGYAPEENLPRLQGRWEYILDTMVAEGMLTQAERDAQVFPEITERTPASTLSGTDGYLLEEVRKELLTVGFSEEEVLRGGLRVTSSFDQAMQAAAVTAVAEERPIRNAEGVRVALASVEPGTGYVRALYGGEDYQQRQFNDATQATIEAGSTFKPFALVAGLEDGLTLKTSYSGRSPRTFDLAGGEEYKVTNFGDVSYGRVSLREATEKSINTAYVDLGLDVGPEQVVDVARRAGIPDRVEIAARASVVLGPAAPAPLDIAGAYATFAADGERAQPRFVVAVTAANGANRYAADPQPERVFDEGVMSELNRALQRVVTNGSGRAALELDRPAAGKTGTSQENRSAWFAGYTPQLVTAVAIFKPDADGNPQTLKGVGGRETLTGGSFPAAIWTAYMRAALTGQPVVEFDEAEVTQPTRGPSNQPQPVRPQSPSSSTAPTATPSTEPTPTATATATPSASPTPTAEPTPTATATATATPTPTPTSSP
jgi:membrane peptidoglycan carboxypeptidase